MDWDIAYETNTFKEKMTALKAPNFINYFRRKKAISFFYNYFSEYEIKNPIKYLKAPKVRLPMDFPPYIKEPITVPVKWPI
jgi:hypothetical protein